MSQVLLATSEPACHVYGTDANDSKPVVNVTHRAVTRVKLSYMQGGLISLVAADPSLGNLCPFHIMLPMVENNRVRRYTSCCRATA